MLDDIYPSGVPRGAFAWTSLVLPQLFAYTVPNKMNLDLVWWYYDFLVEKRQFVKCLFLFDRLGQKFPGGKSLWN